MEIPAIYNTKFTHCNTHILSCIYRGLNKKGRTYIYTQDLSQGISQYFWTLRETQYRCKSEKKVLS